MAYSTIDNPELYFQIELYTGEHGSGTGTSTHTFDGSENMQPDMVWIKTRSHTSNHQMHISTTAQPYHFLEPSTEDALATTNTTALTSFNSDGFTIGSDGVINENTYTYVAWCWKAGTTSGITTNGSTTITPSAYSFNQTSGISIAKFTGNGTAGAKIAHGLGATPEMVIVKRTGSSGKWDIVGSILSGASYYLRLGYTAAEATGTWAFNDTLPDSVNFTVGDNAETNSSDGNVAFSFKSIKGYSSFGTYKGNASADGTFVHTGFRCAWVLTKKRNGTGNWILGDSKRNPGNPIGKQLEVNTTGAEYDSTRLDLLSNGFKCRASGSDANGSGDTYVYMAFAEAPFVNSNGVPCNAR
jgi:hypothetical protein